MLALLLSPLLLSVFAEAKPSGTKMDQDLEGLNYAGSNTVFKEKK